MKKYKLIANPAAGRGKANAFILKTVEIFRKKGVPFDLELTKGPKQAAEIARKACAEFDVIVAIGGDGTVNEIIPGMLFTNKPLGIIPCGSGNDFIKSLNVPNDVEKAADIVVSEKTRVIDVGKINGTYFANGIGIGFDAAVNRMSYSINHQKRGLVLYFCAFLKTLGKYDPLPMKISMNGTTIEQDTFLLSVGNGTTCGGGFKLTPHAELNDNLLDVTIVEPLSLPALFWNLPRVFLGTIEKGKCATMKRTDKLTVESSAPLPVHVDGEIYREDSKSLVIEVIPKALTIIGNF